MSIGNLILDFNRVMVSYLIRYDSYYKMQQILLQNETAILLQNTIEVYYKMCQDFNYKMRHCYYKMQRLLQIATVQ